MVVWQNGGTVTVVNKYKPNIVVTSEGTMLTSDLALMDDNFAMIKLLILYIYIHY